MPFCVCVFSLITWGHSCFVSLKWSKITGLFACFLSNYSYPQCTLTDEETRTEMINRELQISQREKQEILAFEGHLAAASTKQTITESSSLLLSQLTSLDPQ